LLIEDTGPGMSPEDVGKIFKPFARRQRQRGGYGVGLTIVKRLTERFRWPLDIDSEPGRGTRVEIRFPEARTRPAS
jgi:signal transduction histidine kinase